MIRKSCNKSTGIVFTAFLLIFIIFLYGFSTQPPAPKKAYKNAYVILIHGIARSNRSLKKMQKALLQQGYKTINVSYPSRKHTIEFLADEILNKVIAPYSKMTQMKIHFVTHSMGGIIVRYYLKHHKLSNLGRVVMISPPNQGSELVDRMKDTLLFKKIYGPAGKELGTKKGSLPLSLGPVHFELGVIAGNRSFNPIYSSMIPGPDDGIVSVERTKVAGMKDFIVMRHSHTFIAQSKDVIQQVIYFLEDGVFRRKTS